MSNENDKVWHVKSGGEYEILHHGMFQCADPKHDMEHVVIYRGEDQRIWVRPATEFVDGRFTDVDPRSKPQ